MAQPTGNQHEPTQPIPFPVVQRRQCPDRTRGFLRTQLWVWPLVAAVVLAFLGVWLRVKMEGATKQQIADTLQTILNANTEALRSWSVTMKSDAEDVAEDGRVRELVAGLIQQAKSSSQVQATLLTSPQLSTLARPPETRARTPRVQRVLGAGHQFHGARRDA